MRPMLASTGTTVPVGPGWLHEVKWDGIRVLAVVKDGALRLWSRNENDVTVAYPELAGLANLGHDVVLDGEVVAMLDGIPRFGALAERMHVRDRQRIAQLAEHNPVTLLVFDLLSVDGHDVKGEPLAMRRKLLEALDVNGEHWQTPTTYDDGTALLDVVTKRGLEGVVSKKLSSRYEPGRRSRDWLKFPIRPTGSYVVGGWRYETDSRSRIGAVLVGEPTDEGLVYRGRVGSGLAGAKAVVLKERLDPLRANAAPFADEVPREDALGTVWVEPAVVVDIASLGFTPQQRLRQPAYLGIRTDLTPDDLLEIDG
jgi:bifunctional non-homologous end joining protein LigD